MTPLQLEEFPLALLTSTCPACLSRLHYASGGGPLRSMNITAEAGRLPTSGSMFVLLSLAYLARRLAKPDRFLDFSLREVAGAMNQKECGSLYKRLRSSVRPWRDTLYMFEGPCPSTGCAYRSSFRILETCAELPDGRWRLQWSDSTWLALCDGAWSGLEAKTSAKLGSLSLRLYCFINAQVRTGSDSLALPAKELAFERLGVFRSVPARKYLGMIRDACVALEEAGVLRPGMSKLEKQASEWTWTWKR